MNNCSKCGKPFVNSSINFGECNICRINKRIKIYNELMQGEKCPHNHVSTSFSNAVCNDCGEEIANWSRESIEPDYE